MQLLRQLSLRAKPRYLLFVCLLLPFFMVAQKPEKEIKGIVTASKGGPAAGVTVSVKGTKKSVATAAGGAFSILAKEGDVLVFSGISFETREVSVTSDNTYNITLAESTAVLGDVVIVGYGKSSRKTLTSAITTVKPEDLNRGSISDVGQLLQGKVAGLNITASGDPNRNAAVVLRGASTINSPGGPFYVIDGVPGADISTIAPDDIASIDVLKDAAATAIYGNRASSGVIMVTTKRGKKGQMQVAYNGYIGVEKVSSRLKVMDASQLRAFLTKNNLAFTPADDKGANTDWQKATQRNTALSNNHNLSISGGTDHSNYSASLNYFNKQGILNGSNLTRVIGRLSVEQYALNDKVKFGLNVTNSNSSADDIPYRNTVLLQSATYLPVSPVKNADGSYFENFTKSGYYNPVAMMNNSQQNTKTNNLIASFTTQVKLPFDLTYDLVASYQNSTSLQGLYFTKYFTKNYNGMYDNPDPTSYGHGLQTFGTNGQATRSSYQNTAKVFENFLTWDRKFGDHAINAVVGYSWQENVNGDGFQATTSNFPVDNISYNNFALSNPYATSAFRINFGADGVYQKTRLISDFGRLKYSYKDKYLFQGSIRRDGSSVFGANNYWGYFPAGAVAWRVIQENFMQNQQLLSDLKLRASYGVTGNSSGIYAYSAQPISGGSLGNYTYNGVLTSALGASQAANPNLKWEKTATTNIGVDFAVLKNRITFSVDWYYKKTTDMLFGYPVDYMLIPAATITANGGSVTNKGIELLINATPISNKDFSWNTSLNLAQNTNKITSLSNPLFTGGDSLRRGFPEGAGQSGTSLELLKVGHPIGQFFTLKYAGKNSAGVSQYYDSKGNTTTTPISGTDYYYLGDAQPKLLLGWTNTFKYKNFDLNIFLRGVFGNKIFNATRADLFRPATAQYTNILVDAGNESVADYNAYRYSSRFIESGSYLRFDNATLGYNLKDLGKYVKTIRFYASVNNLFVITGFKGVDPEVNQGGSVPGIDYNNFYPKTRTFLFGANVSF
ncbi:MAG: TonB-dependent receptor [Chitinophagaceae bacterium]